MDVEVAVLVAVAVAEHGMGGVFAADAHNHGHSRVEAGEDGLRELLERKPRAGGVSGDGRVGVTEGGRELLEQG